MPNVITVGLIDDHQLFRQSMAAWFGSGPSDLALVGASRTVAELVALDTPAAVVLLDLALGDDSLIEDNVAALRAAGSAVVIVSAYASPAAVSRAMVAGAMGYVPKDASTDDLYEAITAAAAGSTYRTQELTTALLGQDGVRRPQLSRQELRTLRMYAGGMPMKSVALRLGITPGAVKSYIDRVREKYEKVGRAAPTKIDLYMRAIEDDYLSNR